MEIKIEKIKEKEIKIEKSETGIEKRNVRE